MVSHKKDKTKHQRIKYGFDHEKEVRKGEKAFYE